METKIGLVFKKKKISFIVKKVKGFNFIRGLMFRRREKAEALLFDFKKDKNLKIHSCFVSFPFVAIWVDGESKIIEKKIVNPWEFSVSPRKRFRKLVEIPINKKYSKILKILDG